MAKTLYNLKELGAEFGIKEKTRKGPSMICRKCGGKMRHIANTNIFLCENVIKDENGKKIGICGNRVFTNKPA